MKERPNNLKNYFGLFHGEQHPKSKLTEALPAVEVLIEDGKAVEQLALDGDNVVYLPDYVKKNSNPCLSCQMKK
jgi:hypothetical protein